MLRHFAVYVLTKYVTSGVNFLLLMFLPFFLPKSDIGLIATFQSLYSLLFFFVSLNAFAYLLRTYGDEKGSLGLLFQSCMLIMIVMTAIILGLFYLAEGMLFSITGFSTLELLLIPVAALFWQFLVVFLTFYQAGQASIKYSVLLIGRTVLATCLMFLLIIPFEMDWSARIYSFIVSDLILSAILLFLFFDYFSSFKLDRALVSKSREVLKYGVPLVPHNLAMWVLFASDIFFINAYADSEHSATYYMANVIALIIGLFQDAITTAWNPFLFDKLRNNATNLMYLVKYGLLYFLLLSLLGLIVFYAADPFLSYMYGGAYDDSLPILPFLIAAYIFNGIYKFFAAIIFYSKRTMLLWYASLTAAMLNVILNLMVIEEYGVEGVAISTCISFFVSMMISIYLGLRELKLISSVVSEK